MKLHRDLGITQKSAWFMTHRIRDALSIDGGDFIGPVEVDETYIDGKRKNMPNAKRKQLARTGRGAVGKEAMVGAKDRETKQVRAKVVARTDRATLQNFVVEHTAEDATVYTDEASAYEGMPRTHEFGPAFGLRIRKGHGPHQRHGVFLVHAQEGLRRHLSQNQCEAPAEVCTGVCRSAQHARTRHADADAGGCRRHGRKTPDVRQSYLPLTV